MRAVRASSVTLPCCSAPLLPCCIDQLNLVVSQTFTAVLRKRELVFDHRMKVLFLTPYFPPELGAPQSRIYELAVRLVKMGHKDSVLTTFPQSLSGVIPKEW